MPLNRIYLDANAAAPLRPQARDAMMAVLDATGNAQSMHAEGRAARALVADAAALLGEAFGGRAVFTSGGTETNALALTPSLTGAARLFVSAVEHPSVLAGGNFARVDVLPVTAAGVVDVNAAHAAFAAAGAPFLVSLMAANNETGVVQPVAEMAALAHEFGGLLHCDAVQAAGRLPMAHVAAADLVTLSAHKFGGPQGVGALVLRGRLESAAERLRPGTPNVAGVAGMAAAWRAAAADPAIAWREAIISGVRAAAPGAIIFGEGTQCLANTVLFADPAVPGGTAAMALDLAGIAVSTGAACAAWRSGESHVLTAMGAPRGLAAGAVRLSAGWHTTIDDIAAFAAAYADFNHRWRERRAAA